MTDTQSYILAIDQGTSSTKTIVFNKAGQVVAKASVPLKTYYTEGGFVEQVPAEIYQNVLDSVNECLAAFTGAGYDMAQIKTTGISNQRETFVVWDTDGQPLYNAVVWQCKRSVEVCRRLKKIEGLEAEINNKTGLIIDPYFSGTKLIWLYENNKKVKNAIDAGKAYFGTVDTWLLYKLTNGQSYLTDHTNASRTLFFNLHTLQWDQELLAKFGLQMLNFPEIKPSSFNYGTTTFEGAITEGVIIGSMIGDSHAAAFGEGCFEAGTAKVTLGTGCSIIKNIGSALRSSANGMVTTICWSTADRIDYALEGVIVSCGATVEWLKNELGLFTDSHQTEAMALSVPDNNGVYIIPAFSGLGAPHWDMARKAAIIGLTFDCNKNHVARAALESIAYQIKDVIGAMQNDTGIVLKQVAANGGITSNKFVLHFIADLLGCNVITRDVADISAFGAAGLAGLSAGLYTSIEDVKVITCSNQSIYAPQADTHVDRYYNGWQAAIGKTK
jgi:glycerol kinase